MFVKGAIALQNGDIELQKPKQVARRFVYAAPLACLIAAALFLSGCGRKHEEATAGQVIGKVGPDDVTLQELQNEMRVLNIPVEKQKDDLTLKRVLTEIAARKYLVQQSVAAKLDRQPTVLLDVLRSHDLVLAGAYVQREMATKSAAIGKAEVDTFIEKHPNQFAARKEIKIEQVTFQNTKQIEDIVNNTKSYTNLEQVEKKLKELDVKYLRTPGVLDSANLPDGVLTALDAHKSDDVFFVRAGDGGSFFKILSESPKTYSAEDMQALARRALLQDLMKNESADSTKAAVATSKFEGEYGRAFASPEAPAPAPAASPAPSSN